LRMPDAVEKKPEEETPEETEPEAEKEEPQTPLLKMAKWKFLLGLLEVTDAEKADIKEKMMTEIKENDMTPYYKHMCTTFGWMEEEKLVKEMQAKNDAAFKEFDEKEKDARENLGDSEVREALLARADYLSKIGEKDSAIEAYNTTDEKTVGMGSKIDITFAKIRLGLAWSDRAIVKREIEVAKVQVEKGGDWERRNLLCIYEGTHCLITRDFKAAANLLLGSVATFACYKLFDYNQFVFYTVVTSLLTLDRVTLKNKVIKSPEILEVIGDLPVVKSFLFSLYKCKYNEFFNALAEITKPIKKDIYMAPHVGFLMREIRIVAYKQFLEPYKSVTLDAMAETFGVSTVFLDKELARFISAGRLNCKIDKVGGVVNTIRPDNKESQYTETIKQGDILLNRIQKLTKFINY